MFIENTENDLEGNNNGKKELCNGEVSYRAFFVYDNDYNNIFIIIFLYFYILTQTLII